MKKIILVDDSDSIRAQLRIKLEEIGFDVLEAKNGMEGFDLVKKNQDFKIIISDVNMPGMDGVTMLEELKTYNLLNNSGVIILTTETSKKLKARGDKAGVDVWFSKPLTEERLEIIAGLIDKLILKVDKIG